MQFFMGLQNFTNEPGTALPITTAPAGVPLLLITGPPSVGKSACAQQVRLIAGPDARLAVVDRDDLTRDGLVLEDRLVVLARWLADCVAGGATRLVLAWPVRDSDDLAALRRALPWADVTVCRLRAEPHVLLDRIAARETTFMCAHLQSLALDVGPRLDAEAPEDLLLSTDHAAPAELARRAVEHWRAVAAPTGPRPAP
jgi:hypothetical protein